MTASISAVQRIEVNGVEVAYLEAGDGPLTLLLHGFPDSAWSWQPVMSILAERGLRVVAPFQRGYAPSGLAPDHDYRVTTLAADVLALIDALDAEDAHIVGHDWGAAAAYVAAIRAPERVRSLVTAAVPHLRHFLRSLDRAQLWRSRYMFRFQLPGAAARFARPGELEALVAEWSPGWAFTDADLAPLREMLTDPERVRAMLAYYRQMPPSLLRPSQMRQALAPVQVPATIIAGADDGCIGVECFTGQDALFPAGLDLHVLPEAGHFMHCEQPQRFARIVANAIGHAAPVAATT